MTDNLANKFTALETLLGTQHGAIVAGLDAILSALGAPPVGGTVTLADTNTLITQSNTILAGIRADLNDKLAATNTLITATNALLTTNNTDLLSINQLLDTINSNNSTNTTRLLAALYATYCGCTTTAPLLAPPLDVTPTPLVTDEKCKRIQFYMSVFTNWLNKIANYANSTGFVTGDVLGTLLGLAATEAGITATGTEIGALGGPPGAIIGAIIGLITGAVFIFGGSVIQDYATQFSAPVFQHTLLEALYAADNAADGYAAAEATIGASFPTVPAGILNALWYTQWSNDMYGTVPVVDDSAFDGTICAPPALTCTTLLDETFDSPSATTFWDNTFTGYDYYHVHVTAATGNENIAVAIGGVLQVNPYGNYEAYWTTTFAFRLQVNTGMAGGAHVFLEGCHGTAPTL